MDSNDIMSMIHDHVWLWKLLWSSLVGFKLRSFGSCFTTLRLNKHVHHHKVYNPYSNDSVCLGGKNPTKIRVMSPFITGRGSPGQGEQKCDPWNFNPLPTIGLRLKVRILLYEVIALGQHTWILRASQVPFGESCWKPTFLVPNLTVETPKVSCSKGKLQVHDFMLQWNSAEP